MAAPLPMTFALFAAFVALIFFEPSSPPPARGSGPERRTAARITLHRLDRHLRPRLIPLARDHSVCGGSSAAACLHRSH